MALQEALKFWMHPPKFPYHNNKRLFPLDDPIRKGYEKLYEGAIEVDGYVYRDYGLLNEETHVSNYQPPPKVIAHPIVEIDIPLEYASLLPKYAGAILSNSELWSDERCRKEHCIYLLYLQEYIARGKTKEGDGHLLNWAKIRPHVNEITPDIMFEKKNVTHIFNASPVGKLKYWLECLALYIGKNVYVVGDAILNAITNHKRPDVIDVMVTGDVKKFTESLPEALQKEKFNFFEGEIGEVVNYTVPMIRGYYSAGELFVTPSMMFALNTKQYDEYRLPMKGKHVSEIIRKYERMGYRFHGSEYEHYMLCGKLGNKIAFERRDFEALSYRTGLQIIIPSYLFELTDYTLYRAENDVLITIWRNRIYIPKGRVFPRRLLTLHNETTLEPPDSKFEMIEHGIYEAKMKPHLNIPGWTQCGRYPIWFKTSNEGVVRNIYYYNWILPMVCTSRRLKMFSVRLLFENSPIELSFDDEDLWPNIFVGAFPDCYQKVTPSRLS